MARHTKKEFCEKEKIKNHELDHWIYKHGLPVIQIGTRVYIDDDIFAKWIASHETTITRAEPVRHSSPKEIALPKSCRNKGGSNILNKLRLAK